MDKIKTFIKDNWILLFTLFMLLLAFIGLATPFVTSKGAIVTPSDDWYNVVKAHSRSDVNFLQMCQEGTYLPTVIMYSLLLISIVFTILGRFVNNDFYIGATLLLFSTGVFFLTSNTFYDLALSYTLAKDPNLFEELHAVSETKLTFGATFSSIICFGGGLLSLSLANMKDSFTTRDMAEVGVLSALAIGLQFIKIPIGPTGGSINLGLIPLFVIALRHGPLKGFIASALIFGIVTCLTDGYGFNTYPFDYLLGFGGISVIGLFRKYCFVHNKNGYSEYGFIFIALSVIIATFIRFVGSSMSSMINYGYTFTEALKYNAIYIPVTGAVSLVAMEVLYIPLARVNKLFPVKK